MKLSAKDTKEKLRIKTEELLLEKKKADEIERKRLAEKILADKKLKLIAEKSLNAALKGKTTISLGVNNATENAFVKKILGGKNSTFDFHETDAYEHRAILLKAFLETCSEKKLEDLRLTVGSIALNILETYQEHSDYLDYEIDVGILAIAAKAKTALQDQIIYLQSAYDSVDNFFTHNKAVGLNKIVKELKKGFDELSQLLEGTAFFTPRTQPGYADLRISWEKASGKDCVYLYDHVDDFFNSTGLGWLASEHGQLFVGALEAEIEEQIEQSSNSASMSLSKYSSGSYVGFHDDVEFLTLLDEKALTKMFRLLGYTVKSVRDGEDSFNITISW